MEERDQDLDSAQQNIMKPKKFNFFWLAIVAIVVIGLLLWWFMFTPDHPSMPVNVNGKDSPQTNNPYVADSSSFQKEKTQDKKKTEENPLRADALKKGGEWFAENFSPYKNNAISPKAHGDNLSPLDQFRKSYWDGQYKEAIKIFSKLGQAYQNDDNLRFVYAIALAADDKTDVALLELENIIRNKKSIYLEETAWYLGLLHMKQGDMAVAKKYLQQCVDSPKGYNKKEALIILEKVK